MCEYVTDERSCGHSTSYLQECAEALRLGRACENPRKIKNQWASKCPECQRQRAQDEFEESEEELEEGHDFD